MFVYALLIYTSAYGSIGPLMFPVMFEKKAACERAAAVIVQGYNTYKTVCQEFESEDMVLPR